MFARRSRPLTHVMLLVGVLLRTVSAAVTPAPGLWQPLRADRILLSEVAKGAGRQGRFMPL